MVFGDRPLLASNSLYPVFGAGLVVNQLNSIAHLKVFVKGLGCDSVLSRVG